MASALARFALTAMIAATSMTLYAEQPAHAAEAGYGGVLRINAEGKRLCKQYKADGSSYWSGKVRGRFEDGFGGFTDRFTARTCFKSAAACETFLNRIHHNIFPVEQIFFARCKLEG